MSKTEDILCDLRTLLQDMIRKISNNPVVSKRSSNPQCVRYQIVVEDLHNYWNEKLDRMACKAGIPRLLVGLDDEVDSYHAGRRREPISENRSSTDPGFLRVYDPATGTYQTVSRSFSSLMENLNMLLDGLRKRSDEERLRKHIVTPGLVQYSVQSGFPGGADAAGKTQKAKPQKGARRRYKPSEDKHIWALWRANCAEYRSFEAFFAAPPEGVTFPKCVKSHHDIRRAIDRQKKRQANQDH